MIRAIFFDLDGTLIDRVTLWKRSLEGFLADRGLPPLFDFDFFGLTESLRSPFLDRARLADIMVRTFPEQKMTRGAIAKELRERIMASAAPDREVDRVLDLLSARYRTAIVTNGSSRVQWAKIGAATLSGRVDRVFISGEMGTRKPDPAFFRRVLDWAGVAPDDALMVGDHPYEDIFGAQRAGLLTCAVGDRYDDAWPRPDFRVARVVDLPGVLP